MASTGLRLRGIWRSRRLAGQAGTAAWLSLCAGMASAGSSLNASEFWPEFDVYYSIDEHTRALFTVAAARATEGSIDAGHATLQDVQFTANLDFTLAPFLRRNVPQAEWLTHRLFWARVGLDYGSSGHTGASDYRSYTLLGELNSRYAISDDAWLKSRLRVDLRNINGVPSQRYRARVGAEWAATAFEHRFSPYADVEVLYDTRYSRWSRTVLKSGFETATAAEWRVEPYFALQLNKPTEVASRVFGLGLTLKYYFQ